MTLSQFIDFSEMSNVVELMIERIEKSQTLFPQNMVQFGNQVFVIITMK